MLTLAAAFVPDVASAASTTCMSADGSCEISNVPDDMLTCNCADGSGGGFGGGNAWAGLTAMELQPICDAELAGFCGGIVPPPAGIPCGTVNGDCFISNDPFDSIDCECADGSGFGYGGGNSWAGLSDPELVMICENIVDTECAGGPPPPLPGVECSSPLGTCAVQNEPVDYVACECANGLGGEGGGGNKWAGLSPEELEMVCDDQIVLFCDDSGETSMDTGGETGVDTGGEDTGEPPAEDTGGTTEGHDESGGSSGVGDTGHGGSTGGGDTEGTGGTGGTGSEDEDGGGGGGNEGGCSVASPGQAGGAFMLTLLGLLGLGRRRRRAA